MNDTHKFIAFLVVLIAGTTAAVVLEASKPVCSELNSCWLELWVNDCNSTTQHGKTAEIINVYKDGDWACNKLKDTCLSQWTGGYCKWEIDRFNVESCSCYWNATCVEIGLI